jgi:hypothetical protein
MLSPNTKQTLSLPINFSPKTNAWASPFGTSWIIYSNLHPKSLPSPNNFLKIGKSFGVFVEGEYTKFWGSEIYNSSVGLNITLK